MADAARPDVLCIGAVLWDVIGRSPAPMAPGADVPGRIRHVPGGVALNVAVALAAREQSVAVLGAVGADPEGDALLAAVRALGVATDWMQRLPEWPTDIYMAIEDAGGLIAAIAQAEVVSLDPSLIPPSRGRGAAGGGDRPPTPAMVAFAVALAARKGIPLPRGCKSSLARCRAFLDAEAGPAASRTAAPGAAGGPRAPSAAMLRYARTLAAERGLDCPPEVETQFEACRRFLDAQAAPTRTGPTARQARPGPVKPTPGGAATGSSGSSPRTWRAKIA
mgnify:CR=1 FL=1